jgi:hypothetical protein
MKKECMTVSYPWGWGFGMEQVDPPGPILNVEGPENKTLFYRFLTWCLPAEWKSNVQTEVDESFSHLASEDDRAVALVGGLLIENAVNALLSAYVPGYKNLEENRDFSLSLKIELARALRLCPSWLLGAADSVRAIRNDFAHELSLKTFDECKPKHIESVRAHLRTFSKEEKEETSRQIFVGLVSLTCLALRGYKFHVERLNEYVREDRAFRYGLKDYCARRYPEIE